MTKKKLTEETVLKIGNHFITRDDFNWVVFSSWHVRADGTQRMKDCTYHSTLEQAVAKVGDLIVIETFNAAQFSSLTDLLDQVKVKYSALLHE